MYFLGSVYLDIYRICICTPVILRWFGLFFNTGDTGHSISTGARISGLKRFGKGPEGLGMSVCVHSPLDAYKRILFYCLQVHAGSFDILLRVRV